MPRYFLEVAYDGTRYSGFQKQENSNTIQSEVENAFYTLQRKGVVLTGSSRTDAGVHALQNYFHFDFEEDLHDQFLYKANAILPEDIVLKSICLKPNEAHARFDAVSREYEYRIYTRKNPFLKNYGLYYPYKLDFHKLNQAAVLIKDQTSFFSFSKT
jgi:tRNA pseudouridine38-40 synthase